MTSIDHRESSTGGEPCPSNLADPPQASPEEGMMWDLRKRMKSKMMKSISRLVPSRARRQSAGEEEDTGEEDEDILLDMELVACMRSSTSRGPKNQACRERHCASTFAAPPSPVPILLGSVLSSLGRYLSLVLIVAHIPVNTLVCRLRKRAQRSTASSQTTVLWHRDPHSLFTDCISQSREAPLDMQCRAAFLVQSAVVSRGIAPKDISGDLFTKESGNVVNEVKLKVVYAPPLQPASINKGSD